MQYASAAATLTHGKSFFYDDHTITSRRHSQQTTQSARRSLFHECGGSVVRRRTSLSPDCRAAELYRLLWRGSMPANPCCHLLITSKKPSTPNCSWLTCPPCRWQGWCERRNGADNRGERLDKIEKCDVSILCSIAVNKCLTMMLETGVLHCDPVSFYVSSCDLCFVMCVMLFQTQSWSLFVVFCITASWYVPIAIVVIMLQ